MGAKRILEGGGNLHGIVGKATAAASTFLVEANRTRPPYLPISSEIIDEFRRIVETDFTGLLWPSEAGDR
jgi:hypothetical protein